MRVFFAAASHSSAVEAIHNALDAGSGVWAKSAGETLHWSDDSSEATVSRWYTIKAVRRRVSSWIHRRQCKSRSLFVYGSLGRLIVAVQ